MGVRIGVGIGAESVRAVGVAKGAVRWAVAADVVAGDLEGALRELFRRVPRRLWARPAVVAAVGPSWAQVKLLHGLPAGLAERVVGGIVSENASRFFLRNGVPLATSRPWAAEGGTWAAAFERPVLDAVEAACRTARLRLAGVVPAVAVLGQALANERVTWTDGDVTAEAEFRNGRLASARRLRVLWGPSPALQPVPGLAGLGPDGPRFADAYGAGVVALGEAPLYAPGRAPQAPLAPRRRAVALSALAVATATTLLSPALAARRSEADARARLAALAPQARGALAAEGELRRFTAALGDVAGFGDQARPASRLLAAITRVLPDSAAMVSFRMDSSGGHAVVLARRAQAALASLERVAEIAGPEIVGPVTRESAGGRDLERATIRFRFGPPR